VGRSWSLEPCDSGSDGCDGQGGEASGSRSKGGAVCGEAGGGLRSTYPSPSVCCPIFFGPIILGTKACSASACLVGKASGRSMRVLDMLGASS